MLLNGLVFDMSTSLDVYSIYIDGDLFVPRTRTATYGKRAFSAAGPATWNSLPAEIRQSETLTTVIKSKLKTFLFTKSYPVKYFV